MGDEERVKDLVSAYLSNWVKLIEISRAYQFKPVCVLQASGGLDRDYATKTLPASWVDAFTALYDEATRQIESLQSNYPDAVFLNLSTYLQPAADHFWDGVHVYDESNDLLADRIYRDIRPQVSASLPP